jgi:hypothetical protein
MVAPYSSVAARLFAGALFGITMVVLIFSICPTKATAWA